MWFRAAVSPVNVGDHGSKSYIFTLDYFVLLLNAVPKTLVNSRYLIKSCSTEIDPRVKHPYLYISPSDDPSVPLPLASRQDANCDDITTKTIKTGHWIFEQDPKGAADLVLDWGKQKGLL